MIYRLLMKGKFTAYFYLGNIHVLRKHKGGREGVSQMLTIDYKGGGRGVKNPKNLLT